MARVGRLAGAIIAETGGDVYLVGNPKVPCDFAAAGFEPPPEIIDARVRPFIRLSPCRGVEIAPPLLEIGVEGEPLPKLLAEMFLIERTGSVSERLWRLVVDQGDARWLGEIPAQVWQIVRDTVLRCS